MPVSKRTEEDDEHTAEQWMAREGYVDRPPKYDDVYALRRAMRMSYASGLRHGRAEGFKRPHFTRSELETVMKTNLLRMQDVRVVLAVLYPEATFDE